MRAIESAMLNAIRNGRNFNQSNTRVEIFKNTADVYLWGNHIARVAVGTAEPMEYNKHTAAQYPTATTCSRLRALGFNVRRRNFEIVEL